VGVRPRMTWVALVGILAAPVARADANRTSSLSWVALPGAENCGGAGQLARTVENRLHRHALVSPSQADTSIEGRLERSGAPPYWHAIVEVRDRTGAVVGSREFESGSPDCSEIRDSVALAVALMIDPDAVLHPPAPPAEPPTQVVVQRLEVPAVAAPVIASPWRVRPAASVALGGGFLPSPSVGFLADVAVIPPGFWQVDILAGMWGGQTLSAVSRATADFSLAFGGLAICPLSVESPKRIGFDLCAGAEVGAFRSTGRGFSPSKSNTGVFAELVGTGVLRVPVGAGVAFQLRGDAGVAVYRDRFVYTDEQGKQNLFVPSPATASAALGVSIAMP